MPFTYNELTLRTFLMVALALVNGCAMRPSKEHVVAGISPDGRIGITIPVLDLEHPRNLSSWNQLVEVNGGRVIADLDTGPWEAMTHSNHGGWGATWSPDGSLLLLCISGKWTSNANTLVKLKNGKVLWQKNISPDCQKEILTRTQSADPVGYAKKRKAPDGSLTAYPEGFAIDVGIADGDTPLNLPLKIRVDLISDPKAATYGPEYKAIESWLNAELDENGKLAFGEFHLGRRPDLRAGWAS